MRISSHVVQFDQSEHPMTCTQNRGHRVRKYFSCLMINVIFFLAHALPMYRESRPTSTRKIDEKNRKNPVTSKRPDLPITGPGTVSFILKLNFYQHV